MLKWKRTNCYWLLVKSFVFKFSILRYFLFYPAFSLPRIIVSNFSFRTFEFFDYRKKKKRFEQIFLFLSIVLSYVLSVYFVTFPRTWNTSLLCTFVLRLVKVTVEYICFVKFLRIHTADTRTTRDELIPILYNQVTICKQEG